jgi:hypothetical protein
MRDTDWPFADPKNVAVYTVKSIWKLGKPILYVYHDEDDGAWLNTSERPTWLTLLPCCNN